MRSTFGSVLSIAVGLFGELIAPSRCAGCDAPVDPRALFCPACGATLERSQASPSTSSTSDASFAIFEYGGAIATSILRLKYEGQASIGPRIGRAVAPHTVALRGRVDVVVPVPLHPRRLAERGFNQALLIARPIAQSLEVPIAPRALLRVRDTPQQATLDRTHRLLNVTRSFQTNRRARIEGQRVLLVDDVRTTGATLDACRASLREAGASAVFDLVVARRS